MSGVFRGEGLRPLFIFISRSMAEVLVVNDDAYTFKSFLFCTKLLYYLN